MPDAPDPAPQPSTARIRLAVVGAHLAGQPLHHQLSDRSAELVASTTTTTTYRLYALDTVPPKPALVRVGADVPGAGAIEVEVWELEARGPQDKRDPRFLDLRDELSELLAARGGRQASAGT